MGFSRQELKLVPFPSPGDILDPVTELTSPALAVRLYCWATREAPKLSVQFSHSVVSNSLWPHGLQHGRSPCPSPTPRGYPNSCPLSQWCNHTISSSVVPFSSCPQSFPASGSFPLSQLLASDVLIIHIEKKYVFYLYEFQLISAELVILLIFYLKY